MHPNVRRPTLRALLLALAMLAPAPAAHAALNVTLVGGDALEDRPMTFVATGSTDADNYIFATLRPAGPPCAATSGADPGDGLFLGDPSGTQEVQTRADPGSYVVCAYLTPSPIDPPVETLTLPVTVRANTATLAIRAPARGLLSAQIPVSLTGTTELERGVYARVKPVAAGPCASSLATDPPSDPFAYDELATGAFTIPSIGGPFEAPGRYTICAWLQETAQDAVAEASASATIDVFVPIPVLSSLAMSPVSFAALASGGFATTRPSSGSAISYRLENTAASVRMTVAAVRVGRRVGSSCRTISHGNLGRPRCTRYQPLAGSYTHAGVRGRNVVRFSGRVGGRKLKPGNYRLSVTPRTAAGPGRTMLRGFRIVGRR